MISTYEYKNKHGGEFDITHEDEQTLSLWSNIDYHGVMLKFNLADSEDRKALKELSKYINETLEYTTHLVGI